jgi:hypothetical protein
MVIGVVMEVMVIGVVMAVMVIAVMVIGVMCRSRRRRKRAEQQT